MTFSWSGRQLTSITRTGTNNNISYNYGPDGLRVSKIRNGVERTDYYDGDKLVLRVTDGQRAEFHYDDNGIVMSAVLPGGMVYYVHNAQGDVVGLTNISGQLVVEYQYDAWGNIMGITGSRAHDLGIQNPFRYRGYYFDNETSWYYLQSRHYVPEWGRFLNADEPEMLFKLGSEILGSNLYAYCFNNPIKFIDPSGLLPIVARSGSFHRSYQAAVTAWANRWAPQSHGVEFGAIIYRFRIGWITRFFVGETYRGFRTQNWYTVINGLGAGLLTAVARQYVLRFFWPLASLQIIGFAHTHPVNSDNLPSGPDVWLKRLGWIVSLRVFPIAVHRNGRTSVRYF